MGQAGPFPLQLLILTKLKLGLGQLLQLKSQQFLAFTTPGRFLFQLVDRRSLAPPLLIHLAILAAK